MGLHQEVLDFLERDARIEIAAAVADSAGLLRASDDAGCDVTLLCPNLAKEIRHPSAGGWHHPVVVISEEITVPVLREAIDLGARGVFAWPDEREELADLLTAVRDGEPDEESGRGHVLAVLAARGGAGATFLGTHLAAALADLGRRTVIVDLETSFAGLSVALGIGPEGPPRTLADLVPVVEELSPDHVEDALFKHERRFSALLAPPTPHLGQDVTSGLVRAAIALLASTHDAVVLHVPRALDDLSMAALRMADEVLLITTQDLFSLYGARRAMWHLGLEEPLGRCRVVVNRFTRGQLGLADLARVLGLRPWGTVRFDPAVRRVQDLGRLLPPRGRRAGKDVCVLARRLLAAQETSAPTAPSNRTPPGRRTAGGGDGA